MKLEIKSFNELENEELYGILSLRNEIFIVEQNCSYQDIDGKDLESFHMVVIDGNKIIAACRLLPKGVSYKEASIGRVVVKEGYRGRKIGREMMVKAFSFMKDKWGTDVIRISGQAYLQNFYESLGFTVQSELYEEDKIPHLEMVKSY